MSDKDLAQDLIAEPLELIKAVLQRFSASLVESLHAEIAEKNARIRELEEGYLAKCEEIRRLRGDLTDQLGSTAS